VDEAYVKVAGQWRYVYRAMDQFGQVIDVFVSPPRDVRAARRFFQRAIGTTKIRPIEVVTDQAPTYPVMLDELLPAAWYCTDQYANNRVDVCAYTLTLKAERGGPMGTELQGAGGYRVGDADRDRTADLLKEAHAAGYLTLEETDERLGTALAARTRGELDRLVADLPPEWRARQERGQRPAGPPPRQRPTLPAEVVWLVPLVMVITGVILLAVLSRGFWFFPWPLLWIFFFAFGRRGRAGWRPPRW
jgi:hypothetical protein